MLESIFRILPAAVASCLSRLPEEMLRGLEEIRIREGRALEVVTVRGSRFVNASGELLASPAGAYRPTRDDCARLLDKLSNHSLYALEEELRRGYITVRGGHRVGIAGRALLDRGAIRQIRDITCFNVRIAREVPGVAMPLLPLLLEPASGTVRHTLIVSPPGRGKTTLLRDLARQLSYGKEIGCRRWNGHKVSIVDERSELAACIGGVPSFDVGPRTDVLDACPKAEGMMMMIRSMSPEVLVVDEIGRPEDADSIREAMLSGVRVLATAHGAGFSDVAARSVLGELVKEKRFGRYVVLGRRTVNGPKMAVLDEHGKPLGELDGNGEADGLAGGAAPIGRREASPEW
jgi:stage III sporulation protein AA